MKSIIHTFTQFMTNLFTDAKKQEMLAKKLIRIITIGLISLPMVFTLGCNWKGLMQQEVENNVSNSVLLEPYTIQPGDELTIKFYYNPELNENVTVRSDGKISLQLIDEVIAAGLEPLELNHKLIQHYEKELRQPTLTVMVVSSASRRIFVGGEVVQPGVVPLIGDLTPLQARFNQGGGKESASLRDCLVIRKGTNNRPIPIRINLQASLEGNSKEQRFFLKPDDIIYIPKSKIAKANSFVDQYLRQLLMFNGVNFGFTINKDIR